MAALCGFFGALAMVISAVGLFGVISYPVLRRMNEIGIRIALRAGRAGILKLILGQAGKLLTAALAAGILLSLALTRASESMFFGVKRNDPPIPPGIY